MAIKSKVSLGVLVPAVLSAVFVVVALSISNKKELEPIEVKEALTEAGVISNHPGVYEVLVEKQGGSGLEVVQKGLALKSEELLEEGVARVNESLGVGSRGEFKVMVKSLGEASRVIVLLQSAGQGQLSFKVLKGLLLSFNEEAAGNESDLLLVKSKVHELADTEDFKLKLSKWSESQRTPPLTSLKVVEMVEVATNLFFIDNLFDSGKYKQVSEGILKALEDRQKTDGSFGSLSSLEHWKVLKELTALSFYNPSLVNKKVLRKAWAFGLKNKPKVMDSFKESVIMWGALSNNPDLVNDVLTGKL